MQRITRSMKGIALGLLGLGVFATLDATLNPADAVITEFSDGSVYIDIYFFEDGSILV